MGLVTMRRSPKSAGVMIKDSQEQAPDRHRRVTTCFKEMMQGALADRRIRTQASGMVKELQTRKLGRIRRTEVNV